MLPYEDEENRKGPLPAAAVRTPTAQEMYAPSYQALKDIFFGATPVVGDPANGPHGVGSQSTPQGQPPAGGNITLGNPLQKGVGLGGLRYNPREQGPIPPPNSVMNQVQAVENGRFDPGRLAQMAGDRFNPSSLRLGPGGQGGDVGWLARALGAGAGAPAQARSGGFNPELNNPANVWGPTTPGANQGLRDGIRANGGVLDAGVAAQVYGKNWESDLSQANVVPSSGMMELMGYKGAAGGLSPLVQGPGGAAGNNVMSQIRQVGTDGRFMPPPGMQQASGGMGGAGRGSPWGPKIPEMAQREPSLLEQAMGEGHGASLARQGLASLINTVYGAAGDKKAGRAAVAALMGNLTSEATGGTAGTHAGLIGQLAQTQGGITQEQLRAGGLADVANIQAGSERYRSDMAGALGMRKAQMDYLDAMRPEYRAIAVDNPMDESGGGGGQEVRLYDTKTGLSPGGAGGAAGMGGPSFAEFVTRLSESSKQKWGALTPEQQKAAFANWLQTQGK